MKEIIKQLSQTTTIDEAAELLKELQPTDCFPNQTYIPIIRTALDTLEENTEETGRSLFNLFRD